MAQGRYRFMITITDEKNVAIEQANIVNFNYGNKFDPSLTATMGSNTPGVWNIMELVKEKGNLMVIATPTNEITVPFMEALHKNQTFPKMHFIMYWRHHVESNIYRGDVLTDEYLVRSVYTLTDVAVNNMYPRIEPTNIAPGAGKIDVTLLDIQGGMSDSTFGGSGKPMHFIKE